MTNQNKNSIIFINGLSKSRSHGDEIELRVEWVNLKLLSHIRKIQWSIALCHHINLMMTQRIYHSSITFKMIKFRPKWQKMENESHKLEPFKEKATSKIVK